MQSHFRYVLDRLPPSERNLLGVLALLRRLIGSVPESFSSVADGRQQGKINYPMPVCVFSALLSMISGLKSRREFNALLRTPNVARIIKKLFGKKQRKVAHGDTISKAFRQSDPDSLQRVITKIARNLIRAKVLDPCRFLGESVIVAIDGTETVSRKKRHCSHCLSRNHSENSTTYHHGALIASFVGNDALCFPFLTEFIENQNPEQFPQDCETKAFERMALRLAETWPRLKLFLTFDALYATGPVFSICNRYGWDFIVTMKDGNLSNVYEEFIGRQKLDGQNLVFRNSTETTVETYTWVNDIPHRGRDGRLHNVNVLECRINDQKHGKKYRFRWVTSQHITKENARSIARQGGRIRWNIEEGFKVMKVDALALEHAFSEHPVAAKMYHHVIILATLVLQFMHKTYLGRMIVMAATGQKKIRVSFALIMRGIIEAFRFGSISDDVWRMLEAKTLQLRFIDDS